LIQTGRWDVFGIEPNRDAALYTQKSLNVPIYHGRFNDVELEDGSFDVVVLWCVIEHLTNPVEDLRHIYSLLNEGGWLCFSMPNYEGIESRQTFLGALGLEIL